MTGRAFPPHPLAMRFVHLSDLHLGKSFYGYDLLEDQAWMLERAVEIIAGASPEFLVLAGDIYDRAVPSVEAIRLFDTFLMKAVAARPALKVVIIPGNHDSAGRLAFGSAFLAGSGVKIVTQAPQAAAGSAPNNAAHHFTDGAADRAAADAVPAGAETPAVAPAPALVVERGRGGTAAVWALPFLTGSALADAVAAIRPHMPTYSANILIAHCFAAGGKTGDTERAFVGAAEQVDTGIFEGFDYVGLGHLHTVQSPSPRIWYSGSPLAYSVADAEIPKGLLVVDLDGGAPKVERVEIPSLHRIRKISGMFEDLVASPLPEEERGCYVEFALGDAEPILAAGERLRLLYPRILSVHYPVFEALLGRGSVLASGEALSARLSGNADPLKLAGEDFRAFHEEMTGQAPDDSMTALFEGMAKEAANATGQAGA